MIDDSTPLTQTRYIQIRTRKISYLNKANIAVYFQNVTGYVESLRLEKAILKEKIRNESLESFTSTISHEFKTPLSVSLMFLESILSELLSADQLETVRMVISQLNLLLSLVNGVIDIGAIEQNKFEPKPVMFKPLEVIHFIKAMFQMQAQISGTTLNSLIVTSYSIKKAESKSEN